MKLKENERIDNLQYNNLKIIQNTKGFCFGIDSILISDFAKEIRKNSIGVDLGTGTGVISILLTAKTNLYKIYGVEIQADVAEMAKRSIELNHMQNKVEIININLNEIEEGEGNKKLQRESETGKVNKSQYKYISRHELTANLEDFIRTSKYLLKDRGSLYMVHRPERLADIIILMRKYKIEPKRVRFVHSKINKEPTLILIKGVKNANPFLKIEKPLIIYNENGKYTDEIYEIYNMKNIKE